jgi:hypothetical protein
VTVEKGQPVTLSINVANSGLQTYIGFIEIEIDKYVALGFDYAFTSTDYSLSLYPGESTSLQLTFIPDETTGDNWGQCTNYYYKVYTCFACIHGPPDADSRECVYVLERALWLQGDIQPPFGTIDMKDVSYVARRFWCVPGDPLWDPIADINADGRIDMKDIVVPARHFAEHYP